MLMSWKEQPLLTARVYPGAWLASQAPGAWLASQARCSSLLSCFGVCGHTHCFVWGESTSPPSHPGLTPTHLSAALSGGHSPSPAPLHYSLILALHINSIYHSFNYIYKGNYFLSVSCHKTSRSAKVRTTSILLSNNYVMPATLPGT